jgi:hypothetical protein
MEPGVRDVILRALLSYRDRERRLLRDRETEGHEFLEEVAEEIDLIHEAVAAVGSDPNHPTFGLANDGHAH